MPYSIFFCVDSKIKKLIHYTFTNKQFLTAKKKKKNAMIQKKNDAKKIILKSTQKNIEYGINIYCIHPSSLRSAHYILLKKKKWTSNKLYKKNATISKKAIQSSN